MTRYEAVIRMARKGEIQAFTSLLIKVFFSFLSNVIRLIHVEVQRISTRPNCVFYENEKRV
jgi:hypothetical protein